MAFGKIIGQADDLLKAASKMVDKGPFKTVCKAANPANRGTFGTIFQDLQGISGKSTITVEGKMLQKFIDRAETEASGGDAENIVKLIKRLMKKCKNPSLTIGAKASKNGFNVAGVSIRDGENIVASGAASISTTTTKAGVKPQLIKARINTSDGMLAGRAHLDITKPPKVTDKQMLSLNNDNLVVDAKAQIGNTFGAELHLDENLLAKMVPELNVKDMVSKMNQKAAGNFQELVSDLESIRVI